MPHPFSSVLRQRAAHLLDLAARIERASVMHLESAPSALSRRLLARNRHQLRCAVEDLRATAHRFRCRADQLDLGMSLSEVAS